MVVLSFRVTSYNILADTYATKSIFPTIDPAVLSWKRRAPALVDRVAQLESDVACLQEVQASHWPELKDAFAQRGWDGWFAQKQQSRPDGCAILTRPGALQFVEGKSHYFDDGEPGTPASGHLAMIASFETPAGLVRIANTHLRWQAATTNPASHVGYRQADQLLQFCPAGATKTQATIICGDFNASPQSPLVELFSGHGFQDAYAACPQSTCNPNRRAKRIDYIFATPSLASFAEPIPNLADESPMPSLDEPSDHLPLTAVFTCN